MWARQWPRSTASSVSWRGRERILECGVKGALIEVGFRMMVGAEIDEIAEAVVAPLFAVLDVVKVHCLGPLAALVCALTPLAVPNGRFEVFPDGPKFTFAWLGKMGAMEPLPRQGTGDCDKNGGAPPIEGNEQENGSDPKYRLLPSFHA